MIIKVIRDKQSMIKWDIWIENFVTSIREFTQWTLKYKCLIENKHWVWNYSINISYSYPLAKLHTINIVYLRSDINSRKNKRKSKLKNSKIIWDYF